MIATILELDITKNKQTMRTTMNNESSTPAGIRIFVLDSVVIDHKECLVGVAAPGVCVRGGGYSDIFIYT